MEDKHKKQFKDWTEEDRFKAGVYKGYDIRWLRELENEHPAFYLVAEYDAKVAEMAEPKKKKKDEEKELG